ncbi:ketopantoate reductase family protein [Streptococcus macacae]|uniref:Ketopantoate reductase PanE/ApbA domain protein n=1 Tax=Streptococcus macacae NCTC 11558 TaxID=764298 RepID=G5JW40_9STRE|nr:2-dehydropantoate 2-reductase N-terminal domain-containing protein [Streptococcus macacae]EHJ51530.1 ketopantoate reductase PanE/ApbA domain protein [Streptococcus macacae NCTC 11558]SUN79376.1 ketopantoate reductase ApbA/PanE domain-containing protein [Streptococcus macacae NCTC 11558]
MRILIVGLGTIGSIYGYLFQKAGHEVEHYLRKDSPKTAIKELQVDLLDGRTKKDGIQSRDSYQVKYCSGKSYDFIFVSVPSGRIASVIDSLRRDGISGTLLFACGIWEDRLSIERLVKEQPYILAYPVAGGNIMDNRLSCCLFDHFMLERREKAAIPNYQELEELFADCQIKLEQPYDMLEWIWLHMGINAAVISVMGKFGDAGDTSAAAEMLMNSVPYLKEAVKTVRETSQIVASRGVNLKNYKNELLPYQLPAMISAPLMKRMFAKKVLTRKIMTLHGNIQDLLFVCRCLYDSGKEKDVHAPVFYGNYESAMAKFALFSK